MFVSDPHPLCFQIKTKHRFGSILVFARFKQLLNNSSSVPSENPNYLIEIERWFLEDPRLKNHP